MATVEVRPAKVEDLPKVLELLEKEGFVNPKVDNVPLYTKKLEYDPESILVAEYGGEIVGTINFRYDPWITVLSSLAINDQLRGKGIAEGMLLTIKQILYNRGTGAVQAFIDNNNDACLLLAQKMRCEMLKADISEVHRFFTQPES